MMGSMDMTSMFEEIMGEEAMAMGMNMMKPGGYKSVEENKQTVLVPPQTLRP